MMLREFAGRIRSFFSRKKLNQEFDDEMATHLEFLIDEAKARGFSESEAKYEALRKLGQPVALREQYHESRGFPLLEAIVSDARFAVRMLLKTPVFTVIVILTLALGIGANTALFSLVDNLLIRSLPVRDPDQLVQLRVYSETSGPVPFDKPLADVFDRNVFQAVRAKQNYFADVIGFFQLERPTITIDGKVEAEREVQLVSPNFFSELGVSPIAGRSLNESDDHVAMISDRWWRIRFGSRSDIVGQLLAVEGTNYTIIGVLPTRFHGFDLDRSADIWLSAGTAKLLMVARLQPGVSPTQAASVAHQLLIESVNPQFKSEPMVTTALPVGQGRSGLREQYKVALLSLTVLVTLVLLITCANVGNLMILRNAARRRELTVRAALGAGRSRLMVQSLVESTLLAAVGCLTGLLLAAWGVSIIVSLLPLAVPPDGLTFHPDARVISFAVIVSILSVFLFGLGPAWRSTAVNLADTLRSGSGQTANKKTRRLGRVLVGGQVALSVLLLVSAGLFIQTLRNLDRLDMGFRTERLMQVAVDTRYAGYESKDMRKLSDLLYERIKEVPGVRLTSRTDNPVMHASATLLGIPIPGLDRTKLQMWDAIEVGPQFFETMGIEVIRGRSFTAADYVNVSHPPVEKRGRQESDPEREMERLRNKFGALIVNEAFVKHFAPGSDPLNPKSGIVGVVKDAKLFGVKDEVGPVMFLASREPRRIGAFQVRGVGDGVEFTARLREAVESVNPRLIREITTLSEVANQSIAKERMVAVVSGFFGLLGLSLACMGLFGVAAGAVVHRTKELGIRRALGASHKSVIWACLRETLVVLLVGLVVGAASAIVLVRVSGNVVRDLLFGITPTDAANLLVAIAIMVVVAVFACTLPALRATRIDPLIVLRNE